MTGTNLIQRIGIRCRANRQLQGYTQSKLSELTGLTTSMISNIERARTRPRIDDLDLIAKACKVGLADIVIDYQVMEQAISFCEDVPENIYPMLESIVLEMINQIEVQTL